MMPWVPRCSFFHSAIRLGVLLGILAAAGAPPARAQSLDKPLLAIDEEITAFSFAPDGRIVYSVRHGFKTKKYDLEHDDIWLQDVNGKRRRLLQGEKFTRGAMPFTYSIESLNWSPNSRLILAELFTTTVVEDSGKTQDSRMTLVLEDNGKEIHLGGGDSVIKDSSNAIWLLDNSTIVYFAEAVAPNALFSFQRITIPGGPSGHPFEGRTFLSAAAVPHTNVVVAIERDRNLTGPPRMQLLNLQTQEDQELVTLDGFEGGLSVSPSGKRVAYFVDKEILEVRDLTLPDRITRLRVGLGVPHWSADDSRLFLKRSVEKKSGDLVWFDIPELAIPAKEPAVAVDQPVPTPVLHDITIRDFAVTPDGRFLAIISVGKRALLVFPLPTR